MDQHLIQWISTSQQQICIQYHLCWAYQELELEQIL